jgi:hypothetical protein
MCKVLGQYIRPAQQLQNMTCKLTTDNTRLQNGQWKYRLDFQNRQTPSFHCIPTTVEAPLADTSLLRTPNFSPKLVNSIQFDLRNPDTSQLRTAFVSPKGVLKRGSTVYGWLLHPESFE